MNSEHIIEPPRERDVLARLAFAGTMFGFFLFGILVPNSPAGQLYQESQVIGRVLIAAAGILSALMTGDTWMNDIQPPSIQLKWTSRYRSVLHFSGALIYLSAIYNVVVKNEELGPTIAFIYLYGLFSTLGFAIGIRDVLRRPGHAIHGT